MNALTPIFAQQIEAHRQRREADDLAKQATCNAFTARRPVITVHGETAIEAYNRSNVMEDLLIQYGYDAHSNGKDWQSRHQQSGSHATRVFEAEDGRQRFVSLSQSDAEAGLGVKSQSGGCYGDNFDLFVHYEHNGDRGAAIGAVRDAQAEAEAQRRKEQREANKTIGSGSDTVPKTGSVTLHMARERYVFIRDGSLVADLNCSQSLLPLQDFRNALAASKHQVAGPDGATRSQPVSKAWLEDPDRLEADALTFHAGAKIMTTSPDGRSALNLWRSRLPQYPPPLWEVWAYDFVEHIRWLFGLHAEAFLDWLAHIEQRPGELPHYGWIHISRIHGKGRNWISGVLARVWAGHVAASLDLIGVLESGFNNRLSRCMLAIVDEINEGGNQSYRHAQTLRQLVTAEVREINPKFGRRHVEYNATRWVFFSNHTGAIPLSEDDRRFWVVSHEGPAKEEGYYTQLYSRLGDPDFIASVAHFLRARDISNFKPGQRPPTTEAKAELIALTQSEDDAICKELVARWPVDVITAAELNKRLTGYDGLKHPAVRHAMDRAGIRRLRKVRITNGTEIIYSLRDHEKWKEREADDLRSELDSMPKNEKLYDLVE